MDNELVQEVLDRLDSVGAAISEGAVAGFEVLVRQAVISGITMTFWGTVMMLLVVGASVYLAKSANNFVANRPEGYSPYGKWGWDSWIMPRLVVIVPAFLFIILGPTLLTDGIHHLLNPEYYALQEVLRTFR